MDRTSQSFARVIASSILPRSRLSDAMWISESETSLPMLQALVSPGPLPRLARELSLFGQFVGSWDLEITNYPEGEMPKSQTGEWHFGWVLEGRAIMDVWISPRREDRAGTEDQQGDYGATLRFFDPEINAWRSTWIGPCNGNVRPFIARKENDEIVLSGCFKPGSQVRWIFSNIERDHFHWRSVESFDEWKTFRLWQEMSATRREIL